MAKKRKPKTPSKESLAAAKEILAVPLLMGELAKQIHKSNEVLLRIDRILCNLASRFGIAIPPYQPEPALDIQQPMEDGTQPRNYFLNEAHTTHVTKSQARKEREAARKKEKR